MAAASSISLEKEARLTSPSFRDKMWRFPVHVESSNTHLVGVGIHKHLQQRVVHLGVTVALLVRGGLLHKPDEVLLGLIEGVDGGVVGGGHLGLVVSSRNSG